MRGLYITIRIWSRNTYRAKIFWELPFCAFSRSAVSACRETTYRRTRPSKNHCGLFIIGADGIKTGTKGKSAQECTSCTFLSFECFCFAKNSTDICLYGHPCPNSFPNKPFIRSDTGGGRGAGREAFWHWLIPHTKNHLKPGLSPHSRRSV